MYVPLANRGSAALADMLFRLSVHAVLMSFISIRRRVIAWPPRCRSRSVVIGEGLETLSKTWPIFPYRDDDLRAAPPPGSGQ